MKSQVINFNSKEIKKIKNPKNFLGGTGAKLSQMGRMGLPVQPGFTISTSVCERFYKNKKKLDNKIIQEVTHKIKSIKKSTNKKYVDLKQHYKVDVG